MIVSIVSMNLLQTGRGIAAGRYIDGRRYIAVKEFFRVGGFREIIFLSHLIKEPQLVV